MCVCVFSTVCIPVLLTMTQVKYKCIMVSKLQWPVYMHVCFLYRVWCHMRQSPKQCLSFWKSAWRRMEWSKFTC